MRTSNRNVKTSILIALLITAGWATAQTSKSTCMNAGPNVPEPLGDRDGHAVQVSDGTCMTEGGLLEGTVMTQHTIWELDKGVLNILSAHGVSRKPGTTVSYRVTNGALTFMMKDGKPAGWTASGKGVYTLATGSAAALMGKTFSWNGSATGPRSYVIETKVD